MRHGLSAGLGSVHFLVDYELQLSAPFDINLPVNMVRVKNRYLVVNFLYPASNTSTRSGEALPAVVQFHAPTPDAVQPGQFVRMVKDGIAELFGDYGMGMVSNSLKGTPQASIYKALNKAHAPQSTTGPQQPPRPSYDVLVNTTAWSGLLLPSSLNCRGLWALPSL